MIRAHRIRLKLNKEQAKLYARACGVARFSYNWALAKWKKQYEAGEKSSVSAFNKAKACGEDTAQAPSLNQEIPNERRV